MTTRLTAEQIAELRRLDAELDRCKKIADAGNDGLYMQVNYAEEDLGRRMVEHREALLSAAKRLVELERRDWAVRVLDSYGAHQNHSPPYVVSQNMIRHEVYDRGSVPIGRGETPTAARLSAARAVFPELPESVRAEIGEEPRGG